MSHPFADMLREIVAGTRVDSGIAKAKPAPTPEPVVKAAAKPARNRKGNSATDNA